MPNFWTFHWQNRYWRDDINAEYEPVHSSGSSNFQKRGVKVGDVVYVISLVDGQLCLGGRMIVSQIIDRAEAVRILKNDNLYEADEWIIGKQQDGTPLNLRRRLSTSLARQLRFESERSEPKSLFFVSDSRIDNQATRGVRRLTPKSAALLDRIIEITDRLPRSDELITVTEKLLQESNAPSEVDAFRLPEEVSGEGVAIEGGVQRVLVNRYERDPDARKKCIGHYGAICNICQFDFGATYGKIADGLIHVHHLKPISTLGADYQINPIQDLRPVCPNCHAVLHRRDPPYEMDEVRRFLSSQ